MSVKIAERLQRIRSYGERRIPLGPGVVWCSNPDLGTGLCFPIVRLGYRVRLSGPAGAVEHFVTFTNPTAQAQAATFLYPIDRNVTPVKLRGKCGERPLEMEVGPSPVDPTEEEGRLAVPEALCELFAQECEKVLAIPLGEVPPGGEVSFQFLLGHMVYECGEQGQGFSFRLPLLTSQALTTLKPEDSGQTALARGLERGAQVVISIQLEASDLQPGRIATSQTCGLVRDPNGDIALKYDQRKPLEARDFVLDYELWNGPRPKAWLRSQGRHFLLNFFPPANPTPSNPRRLVVLVDGSDEMGRVGADRCLDCLSYLLKNLAPEDRFALVAFNREVAGYKNGDFVEAELASEALDWMKDYQFTGAADLKELLRRVLTLPRQPDSVLSVILLTAGRIGNESELYRLLQGSRDILRLFPIMLGPKADAQFARAAARLTRGNAFRPLTPESVSRAAERVLEHSRQPVLEGVGLQDKGLQYQAESLTPRYPSGLNWRRPITVMGAHSGKGGVDAGGSGPGGTTWNEYVELKPAFHKLLANVWAHVKASELYDESQMLDRAERGILHNVIKNLSRDFGLLNRFTALNLKGPGGGMLPTVFANRWQRTLDRETAKGKSANELLEEQRNQKNLKVGLSKQRTPGRGLTMKDVLGSKSTAAIFGSKLGHGSKLSGSVKEGLFSKPMLKSRGGAAAVGKPTLPRRDNGPAKPAPVDKPAPPEKQPPSEAAEQQTTKLTRPDDLLPTPAPTSPREPEVEVPADMPTRKLTLDSPPSDVPDEPPSTFRPTIRPVSEEEPASEELGEPEPPTLQTSSAGPPSLGRPPTLGAPPTISGPPTIGASRPPFVSDRSKKAQAEPDRPALPTPKELARKVKPEARGGNAEATARNALKSDPQSRQALMAEMRVLHSCLGETDDTKRLLELTDGVLFRLAGLAPNSELLVRAYGLGYQARALVNSDLVEAKKKLKFWLSRFAKLF